MTASEVVWIVSALAWSAAGFGAGYLLGRVGCEVHQVREAVVSASPRPGLPPMRRKGDKRNTAFGVILLAMATLTVALSALALVRLEGVVRCQAAYAEQSALAQDARTKAADEDRQALNTLIREIAVARQEEPTEGDRDARVGRALVRYQARLDESERDREATPFPAPPSEVCR